MPESNKAKLQRKCKDSSRSNISVKKMTSLYNVKNMNKQVFKLSFSKNVKIYKRIFCL